MQYENYLIYSIDNKMPISIPMKFDYISGNITNKNFDLDKALKILKKNKFVLDCSIQDIPWFNRDNDETKYISYVVYLDQKTYDKVILKAKEMDKKFWSVRIEELINPIYWGYDFEDILGINEAYIGEK